MIETDPPATEAPSAPLAGPVHQPLRRCATCGKVGAMVAYPGRGLLCVECRFWDPASVPAEPAVADVCRHLHVTPTPGRDQWGAPCPSHLCLDCGHQLDLSIPEPVPPAPPPPTMSGLYGGNRVPSMPSAPSPTEAYGPARLMMPREGQP